MGILGNLRGVFNLAARSLIKMSGISELRLPKTYLGFPLEEKKSQDTQSHSLGPDDENSKNNRGIALLIAIMVVAMIMVTAADLIVSSQVNLSLVEKQKSRVRAEHLAKSGAALGIFLLTLDYGIDLYTEKMTGQVPGGLGKRVDGLGDIWSMVNGIPFGSETAEMTEAFAEQFGLNKTMESDTIGMLQDFQGQFSLNIADEGNKININYFAKKDVNPELLAMLMALFSCPAEQAFLDKKQIAPKDLAALIKDWIDKNSRSDSGGNYSDEDTPYRKETPPYRAKNGPLYSLEELKMIDGWDEEVHAVFSPYLTIFPYKSKTDENLNKININTAKRSLLMCLIPEARDICGEKFARDDQERHKNKENRSDTGDIPSILKDMMCYEPEKDGSKKDQWFSKKSDVFNIKVSASSEGEDRILHLVIQRKVPSKESKQKYDPDESAYRLLYWRMM